MKKINIDKISKTYKKNIVLNNISVEFESGKIYGIKGVNGSGKTMLMRAILGFIRPDSGNISIDGKVLHKDMEFPESAGTLIENPGLINGYTGFDNLKYIANIRKKTSDDEIKELIKQFGLDPKDKRKVKKYSLGMKQKLAIAEAFIDYPELIVLDEPFNALDEKTVDVVCDYLIKYKNAERIIIVSSHDASLLEKICDKLYYMSEGVLSEK